VSLSDVVPRIVPFGSLPIPTRAQLADVRTSGMQGLIVNTPSFGPGNWFELYLTSEELTAADRAAVYAAKRAAGDTHMIVALSWAYRESGISFGTLGRAPAGFDGTRNWLRFLALLDEIIAAGFYISLHMAGDGLSRPDFGYNDPVGDTYGWQWLMANLATIRAQVGEARAAYIAWCPGFDGCIPGWAGPENDWHRTNEYLQAARQTLGPSAVIALYLSAGYWAWSGETNDWATPDGQQADVAFYEGPVPFGPLVGPYPGPENGSPWDQIWQISKRLLMGAYVRPPDQPADDDPGTIPGSHQTLRGPLMTNYLEISTYDWVRGRVDSGTVQRQRAYLRGCGWARTG